MALQASVDFKKMAVDWWGYVLLACLLIVVATIRWRSKSATISRDVNSVVDKKKFVADVQTATIVPRNNFKWQETKPLQLRTFKPKYHLTMSIESTTISELVEMDSTYLDRINLRRKIMQENPSIALGATDRISAAVNEFYVWIFGTYLPTRYPKMFVLHPTSVENLVNKEHIPRTPPTSSLEALKIMGSHIDHDFLFMLPSEDGEGYILEGFVVCFPSGFDTSKKCGMTLREIHGPVPNYKEKLALSMDRFFDRLEVGKVVKRANWTITTTDELFKPGGTHLYEGEEAEPEDVDISRTSLRCERQLLHRLPTSKAIVFSFETYLYPIQQLRDEGSGDDLANAIEGLAGGSVPAFHTYKRAGVWGDAVKAFLRND